MPNQQNIEAVAFKPSESGPRGSRFTAWQLALLVLALTALAIFWFLFTSKSVQIKFLPEADEVTILGGFAFELGGVYLLREGSYTVHASTELHEPLNTQIEVSDARNQSMGLVFIPLPGTLELTLSPPDALVEIDGQVGMSSPYQLAAGEHELHVSHPRYLPSKEIVDIQGKQIKQSQSIQLQPNWADVAVSTSPKGAHVFIDGEAWTGTTPLIAQAMAGEREISVKLDGYKTHRERIFAQAGLSMELTPIQLVQADAQLHITSRPSAAGITVNGKFSGQTPLTLDLKSNQSHTIQIIRSGYDTYNTQITLNKGAQESLNTVLQRQVGKVLIQVEPAHAQLSINGRIQQNANQTITLPVAPHKLTISLDGYAGYSQTITPKVGLVQQVKVRLLTTAEARLRAMIPTITAFTGQNLRLLEPSDIRMGASRREPGRRANETLREVSLTKLFYLSTTEVSNSQFRQFASGHDSGSFEEVSLNDDDMPAVNVSWHEAAAFCNWLSDKQQLPQFYEIEFGKVISVNHQATGYRLPTEAEWAWAARSTADKLIESQLRFPWGQNLPPPDRQGNYADRSASALVGRIIFGYNDNHQAAAPVATFKANHLGLFDMGGNAAEWINDFYGIPDKAAVTDPLGPSSGDYHVIRGSSWMHGTITELRFSFRDYGIKGREDIGFRIARFAE
ncbi:MAG: PEGA domain-containing protein [Gammaproteobacteria bacterium]|nr:PEGA domain-containing protein [Gammaproteobacteria bacterium]